MQEKNGKKPLLIGGAIIAGVWLLNMTYRDGFIDGLLATGKGGSMHYAGSGFPWGLLIIGGIIYFLWSKGIIGKGGPGRHGNGHYGPPHGNYNSPATMQDAQDMRGAGWDAQGQGQGQGGFRGGFGGPKAMFDEWHRQAHADGGSHANYPVNPQAAQAPQGQSGQSFSHTQAAPPPPPAAEYWTTTGAASPQAGHASQPGGPVGPVNPPASPSGATGPATEQW